MNQFHRRALTLAAIAGAALALVACGEDSDDNAAADGDGSASGLVSIESVEGTEVLVDNDGRALYTSEPEESGRVRCTAGCLEFWEPIVLTGDESPPEDLGVALGVVDRPDGDRQLTLEGAPLYSFTEEGPGELAGDGVVDEFDGTQFTWRAAATAGAASPEPAAGAEDEAPAGGYGY
jgi:predicted lipoprotein with Yx(FWY)xxD motif